MTGRLAVRDPPMSARVIDWFNPANSGCSQCQYAVLFAVIRLSQIAAGERMLVSSGRLAETKLGDLDWLAAQYQITLSELP